MFRMELLGAEVRHRDLGQPHAEGRGERGAARVGGHASRTRTTASARSMGPHPFPLHGARVPARRRRRGPAPVPRSCSTGTPRRRRRLRRRRIERRGHLRRLRRHRGPARRGRGGRRCGDHRRASPASCTACARGSSRTRTARSSRRTRSRPGSTTRASVPSTPILAAIGRAEYPTADDDEVLDAFELPGAHRGDHPRARVRARRRLGDRARPAARSRRARRCSSRSRAGATRTWPRSRALLGGRAGERSRSAATLDGAPRRRAQAASSPTSWAACTDDWLETAEALVAAGADAVEVGLPFSDPMIDGPVIQAAATRALERGTTVSSVARRAGRPLARRPDRRDDLLRTWSPAHGYDRTAGGLAVGGRHRRDPRRPPARGARRAGRTRPHAPGHRDRAARRALDAAGAPGGGCARAREGFLYAMGRMGIDGGDRRARPARPRARARRERPHRRSRSCLGVGVSTPDHAAAACRAADGVIVGTAIVRRHARRGRRPTGWRRSRPRCARRSTCRQRAATSR